MMSVLEYANDVNKTVSEILNLCKKLNIEVNNEDDYLDEEAIIELDNSLDEIEEAEELEDLEYEDELIEKENENKTNFESFKLKKHIDNTKSIFYNQIKEGVLCKK